MAGVKRTAFTRNVVLAGLLGGGNEEVTVRVVSSVTAKGATVTLPLTVVLPVESGPVIELTVNPTLGSAKVMVGAAPNPKPITDKGSVSPEPTLKMVLTMLLCACNCSK